MHLVIRTIINLIYSLSLFTVALFLAHFLLSKQITRPAVSEIYTPNVLSSKSIQFH